MIASNLFI